MFSVLGCCGVHVVFAVLGWMGCLCGFATIVVGAGGKDAPGCCYFAGDSVKLNPNLLHCQ